MNNRPWPPRPGAVVHLDRPRLSCAVQRARDDAAVTVGDRHERVEARHVVKRPRRQREPGGEHGDGRETQPAPGRKVEPRGGQHDQRQQQQQFRSRVRGQRARDAERGRVTGGRSAYHAVGEVDDDDGGQCGKRLRHQQAVVHPQVRIDRRQHCADQPGATACELGGDDADQRDHRRTSNRHRESQRRRASARVSSLASASRSANTRSSAPVRRSGTMS